MRSYNVQIWVGLRSGYSDKIYTINDVRMICDNYISEIKDCVTITPTEFRYVGGWEPGVIIGFIQYPRFPRKRKEIKKRAITLGKLLLEALNQNRITITTPYKSYMLEK